MQHFSFIFFPFFASAMQLFPLRLRHQTSAAKLLYLRSSVFYRETVTLYIMLVT